MKTQAQELASYIQEEYEKERNSKESTDTEQNKKEFTDIQRDRSKLIDSTKSVLTIRINNLQFRSTSQSSGEFIKWFPNQYYNKLSQHLQEGWEDCGEYIKSDKLCYSISKSCFANPETCIVIAWLKADKDENCCNLTSVGPRILNLTLPERNDFFEVYTLAETKLIALANESEN